jgi:FkbM family methyltransferase
VKKIIKNIFKKCGFEIRRYEMSEEILLKHFFNFINADLMIDVGANTGQSRDFVRSIGYKGRIVSFEPLASAHDILKEKSKHDKLWDIAPRIALADVIGECVLNVSKNYASSSILNMLSAHLDNAPESYYTATELILCSTLDAVWEVSIAPYKPKSIFLKIDVQGCEDKVIRGAISNIGLVKGMQIELSVVPLYKDQKLLNEMLGIIYVLGFELYALLPVFADKKTNRILQFDGLFFRK